jgi:hypothetical protein
MAQTENTELQTSFANAARLANRLQDWMRLDQAMMKLQISFDLVARELDRAPGGIPDVPRVRDLWRPCHINHFVDLENVVISAGNLQEAPDPVQAWFQALGQLRTEIQDDLRLQRLQDLRDHCSKLQDEIIVQTQSRRHRIEMEVNLLCQITFDLKKQLDRSLRGAGNGQT